MDIKALLKPAPDKVDLALTIYSRHRWYCLFCTWLAKSVYDWLCWCRGFLR